MRYMRRVRVRLVSIRIAVFKRRGWVDLAASVPLILLNSGPAVLALAAGGVSVLGLGGILNVLKVIKAIRIARILRLLRVLKIFKQIKYADKVGIPLAVIAGSDEFEAGTITVKNLEAGRVKAEQTTDRKEWLKAEDIQETIPLNTLVDYIKKLNG